MRFPILVALFLSLHPLCKKVTDGFALTKISHQLLETRDLPLDEGLLERSWTYLGKGGQCYVFASEDGTYVLKFLRASKESTLSLFHPLFDKRVQIERAKTEETLKSYQLASELLAEETGLVATHLGRSASLKHPIKIIDNLGIEHTIDADSTPFFIQKRATMVKEKILQWAEANDLERAKEGLSSLFALFDRQKEQGIEDQDPNLGKNFGFLGDTPIEIDGGRYSLSKAPSLRRLEASKEDLQHFINEFAPGLSPIFDETYNTWKNSHERL